MAAFVDFLAKNRGSKDKKIHGKGTRLQGAKRPKMGKGTVNRP